MEVIECRVPLGSLGTNIVFTLHQWLTVSNACFPILFADDTNIFTTGKSIEEMCTKMNDELKENQGWLNCNKLSLNVLKTQYMLFAHRNKCINDADIRLNNISTQRVYVTKFYGVLIVSKLNWKNHIDYICKKLAKCIVILLKARTSYRDTPWSVYIIHLYILISFIVIMFGKPIVLMQKELIRIITCSPNEHTLDHCFC